MEEEFPGFNLVYYHKETGEKYLAKRVTKHDFILLDLETKTKLPLSKWGLDKSFRADKDNEKTQKRVYLNFKKRKLN